MAWDIGADEYVRWDIGADEYAAPYAPSTPHTVSAGVSTGTTIALTWIDPNVPKLPMRPFYRVNGTTEWFLASLSLPANTNAYTFEDLEPVTNYQVGVAAWDDPLQSPIGYDTSSTTAADRTALVTAVELEAPIFNRRAIVTAFEFETDPSSPNRAARVTAVEFEVLPYNRTAQITAVELETTGGARSAIVTAVEFTADFVVEVLQPILLGVPPMPAPPAVKSDDFRLYDRESEAAFRREVDRAMHTIENFVARSITGLNISTAIPDDGDVLTWVESTGLWTPLPPA